jgi:hypothetical protein
MKFLSRALNSGNASQLDDLSRPHNLPNELKMNRHRIPYRAQKHPV